MCAARTWVQGDYHRYLAEFKTGTERKEAAEHTLLAYKAAQVGGRAGGGDSLRVGGWCMRCWLPGDSGAQGGVQQVWVGKGRANRSASLAKLAACGDP